MYFLGQASTYKFKDVLRHTFAIGSKSDFKELRAYLAAHYGTTKDRVALYHTGRTALAIALERLVPPESEVLVTSLTCFAVYEAVLEAGCKPVFADIDPETLHFGLKELKTALGFHPEISAVVVQNNLGIPCDIKGIEKICKKYNLVLIEDLAHCTGVHYRDGREAGTIGDAAVLSFGKGKSIDTISGGAVVFTNPDSATVRQPEKRPRLADRLRDRWYPFFGWQIRGFYHLGSLGRYFTSLLLKLHFIQRSADADLDPRVRLTYWQAKLALKQLQKLPRSGRKPLRDHYFVEDRDRLLRQLEKAGYVFDDIWYNCPVSPLRYYRRLRFPEDECPVAVWAADHLVNVPTWYPKKALRPALRLIERSAATFDELPTPASKPSAPAPKPAISKNKPTPEPDTDFDFAEESEEPEEYYLDEDSYYEPEDEVEPEEDRASIEEVGGTLNYSELVYDKFDHSHLNRTNILDNSINSDGTAVSLTKEERRVKPTPIKNNLPKIRQYKKPEKGPETTEGKVW
ncbi:aminotransferase class I/II-fold pyridoxal phosphate-dependent enzyme [Candidatus Saccharibacteria bacterium]|nr:aminotransferase class I/II-fold pyridoxal phosphate-dependent enzyme [Candidatus Saccharibacteria bacterium]